MLGPRLRHRVTLQSQAQTQDPTTGASTPVWIDFLVDEPAEFVPLSGREYIQAQTTQAEVTARVTLRERPGIDASMRLIFDGAIYQLVAPPLPDPSARRHLSLLVKYLEPVAPGDVTIDGGDAATEPTSDLDGGGA